jgi:hypothetical protein
VARTRFEFIVVKRACHWDREEAARVCPENKQCLPRELKKLVRPLFCDALARPNDVRPASGLCTRDPDGLHENCAHLRARNIFMIAGVILYSPCGGMNR